MFTLAAVLEVAAKCLPAGLSAARKLWVTTGRWRWIMYFTQGVRYNPMTLQGSKYEYPFRAKSESVFHGHEEFTLGILDRSSQSRRCSCLPSARRCVRGES